MPDAALRVAVIGYGLAGAVFHAPLISATAGLEVAAVVTTSSERRARAARDLPQARLMSSPDEIWADPSQFALVVVASPNRTHFPIALQAIRTGLAVVVDKPVAATAADAIRLSDAATERGTPITVFQNRRWDGDFLTVGDLLSRDALGPVHRFESRFERWRPAVVDAWRESPDPADAGGVLFDLGSHLIDQAQVLFGPVESVYAEIRRVRAGARVDDDAFVALSHRQGATAHLWMSLAAPDAGPRLRVLGAEAAFVSFGLDVQESQLRAGRDPTSGGWAVDPEVNWGELRRGPDVEHLVLAPGRYEHFYYSVAEALAGRGPMPVDINDAVATLQVIEAARRSATEHRAVGAT